MAAPSYFSYDFPATQRMSVVAVALPAQPDVLRDCSSSPLHRFICTPLSFHHPEGIVNCNLGKEAGCVKAHQSTTTKQ